MSTKIKLLLAVIALTGLVSLCGLVVGCNTGQTPASTTGRGLETVHATAEIAMTAWGNYVGANHPSAAQEQQVLKIWMQYKAAELAALNATDAWLKSGQTNAPAGLITAQQAEAQALSNLITLIQSFGIKLQ